MLADLYQNLNFCKNEVLEARKIMTSPGFTKEKAQAVGKGLALVYLYCPQTFEDVALSTLEELNFRERFTQ